MLDLGKTQEFRRRPGHEPPFRHLGYPAYTAYLSEKHAPRGRFSIGTGSPRSKLTNPALWIILWGLLLSGVYVASPRKRLAGLLVLGLLAAQIGLHFKHYTVKAWPGRPPFEAFFSAHQFEEVKRAITLAPGEKVGCIGFYPSVARYNGLDTLGFYRAAYPLAEKERIHRIIKKELAGNPELDRY